MNVFLGVNNTKTEQITRFARNMDIYIVKTATQWSTYKTATQWSNYKTATQWSTYSHVSISSSDRDNGQEGALILTDCCTVGLINEHWWVLVT